MDKLRWTAVVVATIVVVVVVGALTLIGMPGSAAKPPIQVANGYSGAVPAGALLRVPVSGIYPGGVPAGLNPNMQNPLANDPDAAARGMKDFDAFNCSGCHAANAGGGMGPSLSNDRWIYRDSAANIYLDIVQGRSAGMPAFGAMLPDRTVWELVAYIQSISKKPPANVFGDTTSASPQSPDVEQVPAGQVSTTTPWKDTEPLKPGGVKPDGSPPNANPGN
jgi:cytochrome c oxidase cbb3-type subunit 3